MKLKKSYLIFGILVMAMTSQNLNAQIPAWSWVKHWGWIGGVGGAKGVTTDGNGNVVIIGDFALYSLNFDGNYVYNCSWQTNSTIYTVKLDSSGNVAWAKGACGDYNYIYPKSITADNAGNIFVAGYFSGDSITFDNFTLIKPFSFGLYDNMFIVKYDPNGNVLWAKCATGTNSNGSCRASSVAVDHDGNCYVTGAFSSGSLIFDNDTIFNTNSMFAYGDDIYIVKFNSSGNTVWAKNEGGKDEDEGSGIAVSDNDIYLTGSFASDTLFFGGMSLTNANTLNGYNFFIGKLDTAGNEIWVKTCSQGSSFGANVASMSNNLIYLAGNFYSTSLVIGTDTLLRPSGSWLNRNPFIVAYDTSGNPLWAKAPSSYGDSRLSGLSADSFGNCYITGYYSADSIFFDNVALTNIYYGFLDLFVVSYDSAGNVKWGKSAGGIDQDFGLGIATDNSSVYITGTFWSDNIAFDSLNLFANGGGFNADDVYIAKLGNAIPTGISQHLNNFKCLLWPNPFNDKLTVFTNSSDNSEIIIYDLTGRKLLQKDFTHSIILNTLGLSNDIYIYDIKNKNGVIWKGKIVKN